MNNPIEFIMYAVTVAGIFISFISIYKIRKGLKKLNNSKNTEFFYDMKNLKIRKYFLLTIIGSTLTSLMQLIRIFYL